MTKERAHRGHIVLLGDSITQMSYSDGGFAAVLADHYQRRLDVLNRGYSGYTSRWILELVNNDIHFREEEIKKAALLVIFLGANDASLLEHNARQHVPIKEYEANIRALIQLANTQNIVLITPPPVGETQRIEYQKQRYGAKATGILERTNANAGLYANSVQKIAKELKLPCIDLFHDMQSEQPHDFGPVFLSDGLHLSPRGYRFLSQRLIDTINSFFPSLKITPCPFTGHFGTSGSTSHLSPHAPWHDAIIGPSLTDLKI